MFCTFICNIKKKKMSFCDKIFKYVYKRGDKNVSLDLQFYLPYIFDTILEHP